MLHNLIDQSAAAFFDQYRFVTPADYCVYNCKNACLEAEDIPCYAIWQRDTPCHNCSSIRALSLKEPVKMCIRDRAFYRPRRRWFSDNRRQYRVDACIP